MTIAQALTLLGAALIVTPVLACLFFRACSKAQQEPSKREGEGQGARSVDVAHKGRNK